MKMYTKFESMNSAQLHAYEEIETLLTMMKYEEDEDKLLDLFARADNLLTEYFPWDVQMGNGAIDRHFINCQRSLAEKKKFGTVVFNNCTFNDCAVYR